MFWRKEKGVISGALEVQLLLWERKVRVELDGIAWFTDVVLLEYLTVLSYQYNVMTGRKPAGKACLIVLIEIEEIMVVLGTKFVNMTHTHFKMGK